MVSKWMVCNPLTIEERRKIKEAIDLGMCYREMGLFVGRNKSVVRRESKRLGEVEDYDPDEAQKDFEKKNVLKKQKLSRKRKLNGNHQTDPKNNE